MGKNGVEDEVARGNDRTNDDEKANDDLGVTAMTLWESERGPQEPTTRSKQQTDSEQTQRRFKAGVAGAEPGQASEPTVTVHSDKGCRVSQIVATDQSRESGRPDLTVFDRV